MLLPLELLFVWTLIVQCSAVEYNISKLIDRSIPEESTFLTATDFENAEKVNIDFDSLGIKVSNLDDDNLYQGDIVLEKYERGGRMARSASYRHMEWKSSTVPYELSTQFGEDGRAVIASAIIDYQKYTCIRFVERQPSDRDYIFIYAGDGCHSRLGHTGGQQKLSLEEGCLVKGIVMHELMHALSFVHEQSRNVFPSIEYHWGIRIDSV